MIKKITALLLCLVMAFTLLGAITVSAAATGELLLHSDTCGKTGNYNYTLRRASDYTQNDYYRWRLTGIDGSATSTTARTHYATSPATFKLTAGATYKVKARVKVDGPAAGISTFKVRLDYVTSGSVTNASVILNYPTDAQWHDLEGTFTPSSSTETAALRWGTYNVNLNGTNTYLAVDNFEMYEITPKVSVSVEDNGSVVCDGTTIADGYSVAKAAGSTMTFAITPDNGYEAVVTWDGQELPVVNGQVTITVPADDTAINVTFDPIPVEKAIVETEAYITDDNTIYVYSLISQYNVGDASYCGIYFNGTHSLYALKNGSTTIDKANRLTSKPGMPFIIKVENADPDETYTVQPFVGNAPGEKITLD